MDLGYEEIMRRERERSKKQFSLSPESVPTPSDPPFRKLQPNVKVTISTSKKKNYGFPDDELLRVNSELIEEAQSKEEKTMYGKMYDSAAADHNSSDEEVGVHSPLRRNKFRVDKNNGILIVKE